MKKCIVRGCLDKQYARGYCNRHYLHIIRFGSIKTTVFDKNKIYCRNEVCYIELRNKKCDKVAVAKVDKKNIQLVLGYKWGINFRGYVNTAFKGKMLFIHHIIFGKKNGLIIDHINGDKTDNRMCNLRYVNFSQNVYNRITSNSNKTIGVAKRENGKWRAYINLRKKRINLGTFSEEKDAIMSRKVAEEKYYGKDFRKYNFKK